MKISYAMVGIYGVAQFTEAKATEVVEGATRLAARLERYLQKMGFSLNPGED